MSRSSHIRASRTGSRVLRWPDPSPTKRTCSGPFSRGRWEETGTLWSANTDTLGVSVRRLAAACTGSVVGFDLPYISVSERRRHHADRREEQQARQRERGRTALRAGDDGASVELHKEVLGRKRNCDFPVKRTYVRRCFLSAHSFLLRWILEYSVALV